MSALAHLREAMVTSRDLVTNYDSDAVSQTSTAADEEGEYYTPNCIVAEDSEKQHCYLVSWEAYPLDQCTWEPPWHLDGTNLIARWEQLKEELGTAAFQRENQENIEAYEEAQAKAQANKARRHAKRERERRRLLRRDRRAIFDEDSSDEEPPLPTQTHDSLFVHDREPSTPASSVLDPSRKAQSPVARRPPLQQSSSEGDSSSAEETLNHPTISEPRISNTGHKDDRSATKKSASGSVLTKRKPDTSTSTKTPTDPVVRRALEHSSRVSPASIVVNNSVIAANSVQPKPLARTSTTSNTMRAIRTAQPKQPSRAINFIDEPNKKKKKQWSTDQQYSKLKYRGLAEKRSRTEGAPDFSVLSFMNGPPPTLPKAAFSRSNDNPYGRRESTKHRGEEEEEDNEVDRPRHHLKDAPAPLAAWEANKVPLVCFHWKTMTCSRSARDCRFMHRDTNPEGVPYRIGDFDGRVPHKYHKPPITCLYWYKGRNCTKTAEECSYAHEDTGWAEINGVRVEITRLPPEYLALVGPSQSKPRDSSITCSYWLRDPRGCSKSAEVCKYAHRNTGWARPESDAKGQPIRIDPGLKPRGGPLKYANPPVTCPFWLRAERGCTKPDDECKYAHWNTGWAPSGLSNDRPLPINPERLPHSQTNKKTSETSRIATLQTDSSHQAKKDLTCPSWLRDPQGCSRSDEACNYAHRNTGWATPKDRPFDPPVPLDPNQIPRSHRDSLVDRLKPKHQNPPVTCSAWFRSEKGCGKSDEACQYAHKNTGWILQDETSDGPAVAIDRADQPRHARDAHRLADKHVAPKFGNPPVTCFFWLKGSSGCAKSAANCRFAHKNTGWIIQPGLKKISNPERIDPTALPLFLKFDWTETAGIQDGQTKPMVQPSLRPGDKATAEWSIPVPIDIANGAVQDFEAQHVQSPLEIQHDAQEGAPAIPTASQIRCRIESSFNLDITEIFCPLVPGDNDPLERQAMLLYDPKEHSEEIELITRWLLLHNVRVANLWYSGAWSQFRDDVEKHKSGVIIVHPDFEHFVNLPGFGDTLKQRVRVWSVGLQPPPEFIFDVQPTPAKLRYERVGLFPHGGLIYITDDVFEQKPQLALSIVNLFVAKIEQLRRFDGPGSWWLRVDDAYLLWRLCVRPELMEHLYSKCRDNPEQLAAGNPDYLSRVDLYSLLTLTHYIEQDNPIVPLSTVKDKFPILSHRRELAEDPTINYFNLLESSQEEANTQMIGHFAAIHSAFLRRDYRYFYVVHTEPKAKCAEQWRADIHTITDIITPERCIEELTKPSKESLLDFMDWALGPKDKNSDATPAEAELGDTSMDMSPRDDVHEVEHTAY